MCGVFREGVAVKYAQIESLRQRHPVSAMCRLLGVSEQSVGLSIWVVVMGGVEPPTCGL
jgi:hypothetical protein